MIHKTEKPAPLFDAGKLKEAAAARAAENPGEPGVCDSCGERIIWVKSENGKNMPLDEAPLRGLFTVDAGGVAHSVKARVSHFGTCPNANQHRKS